MGAIFRREMTSYFTSYLWICQYKVSICWEIFKKTSVYTGKNTQFQKMDGSAVDIFPGIRYDMNKS